MDNNTTYANLEQIHLLKKNVSDKIKRYYVASGALCVAALIPFGFNAANYLDYNAAKNINSEVNIKEQSLGDENSKAKFLLSQLTSDKSLHQHLNNVKNFLNALSQNNGKQYYKSLPYQEDRDYSIRYEPKNQMFYKDNGEGMASLPSALHLESANLDHAIDNTSDSLYIHSPNKYITPSDYFNGKMTAVDMHNQYDVFKSLPSFTYDYKSDPLYTSVMQLEDSLKSKNMTIPTIVNSYLNKYVTGYSNVSNKINKYIAFRNGSLSLTDVKELPDHKGVDIKFNAHSNVDYPYDFNLSYPKVDNKVIDDIKDYYNLNHTFPSYYGYKDHHMITMDDINDPSDVKYLFPKNQEQEYKNYMSDMESYQSGKRHFHEMLVGDIFVLIISGIFSFFGIRLSKRLKLL